MTANVDANNGAGPTDVTDESTAGSSDVGYGRPPKNFRFRPGQSGNPSGRPKGSNLSFISELAEELSAAIRVNDTDERTTNKRAIVKHLIAAAKKNPNVAIALIALCSRVNRGEEEDPRAAADEAFVEKLAERESSAAANTNSTTSRASTEGETRP